MSEVKCEYDDIIVNLNKDITKEGKFSTGENNSSSIKSDTSISDTNNSMLSDVVTEGHVAEVVAKQTGIPVGTLLAKEAEQLLQIRASDTTVMAVSLYADNDAMERASAARSKRMSNNENTFDVVDTKTGEVTLNHKN